MHSLQSVEEERGWRPAVAVAQKAFNCVGERILRDVVLLSLVNQNEIEI